MLALCACSLYANTGGSSAVGSTVRGVRVGLGSDHRRSVAPHGSPPGHRAPPHILSNFPVLVLRAVLVTFTIVRRTSATPSILGGPVACATSRPDLSSTAYQSLTSTDVKHHG